MIPPSSSDRLVRQRLREQASRRVTTTTRTLGVLSAAGAGVLALVFTHSTHTAGRSAAAATSGAPVTTPAASSGGSATSPSTGATAAPSSGSAAGSATAPATSPATITPTTQAPQVTYQAPVATSGGS